MSKTLNFGARTAQRLTSRIDRMVIRRRTPEGYDRAAEAAYIAYSADVARQVSPSLGAYQKPAVTFRQDAPRFGKRDQLCDGADCGKGRPCCRTGRV